MGLECDDISKAIHGLKDVLQPNVIPPVPYFCAQLFTVRAQPFCTEFYRIALPVRCWVFVLR